MLLQFLFGIQVGVWVEMCIRDRNKSLLASYLFGSPEHAGQINGIVHPRVKEDFSSGFVSVRHAGWQESSLLF